MVFELGDSPQSFPIDSWLLQVHWYLALLLPGWGLTWAVPNYCMMGNCKGVHKKTKNNNNSQKINQFYFVNMLPNHMVSLTVSNIPLTEGFIQQKYLTGISRNAQCIQNKLSMYWVHMMPVRYDIMKNMSTRKERFIITKFLQYDLGGEKAKDHL